MSEKQRPTPETNSLIQEFTEHQEVMSHGLETALSEHARRLERERDEAREQLAELTKLLGFAKETDEQQMAELSSLYGKLARAQATEKDAERYRWLRVLSERADFIDWAMENIAFPDQLDAAIDDALTKSTKAK